MTSGVENSKLSQIQSKFLEVEEESHSRIAVLIVYILRMNVSDLSTQCSQSSHSKESKSTGANEHSKAILARYMKGSNRIPIQHFQNSSINDRYLLLSRAAQPTDTWTLTEASSSSSSLFNPKAISAELALSPRFPHRSQGEGGYHSYRIEANLSKFKGILWEGLRAVGSVD
jgi:hypothetical protein